MDLIYMRDGCSYYPNTSQAVEDKDHNAEAFLIAASLDVIAQRAYEQIAVWGNEIDPEHWSTIQEGIRLHLDANIISEDKVGPLTEHLFEAMRTEFLCGRASIAVLYQFINAEALLTAASLDIITQRAYEQIGVWGNEIDPKRWSTIQEGIRLHLDANIISEDKVEPLTEHLFEAMRTEFLCGRASIAVLYQFINAYRSGEFPHLKNIFFAGLVGAASLKEPGIKYTCHNEAFFFDGNNTYWCSPANAGDFKKFGEFRVVKFTAAKRGEDEELFDYLIKLFRVPLEYLKDYAPGHWPDAFTLASTVYQSALTYADMVLDKDTPFPAGLPNVGLRGDDLTISVPEIYSDENGTKIQSSVHAISWIANIQRP